MKILVAEDDRVSAKVLQKALEILGHQPTVCYTGAEAWEAVQRERFQVVISDWMMPEVEGPELCRRIRSLPGRSYAFFLILTARGQKEDRIEAMRAGADDFLSKPLDREELQARLTVAERILEMQTRLEEQNVELDAQRTSLEFTNLQLKQQQEELSIALRSLEATSKIAEVSRNRFSQLFEGLPVACFTYDEQEVVYEWNRRSEEMFGVPPHEAIGKKVADLLGPGLAGEPQLLTLSRVFKGRAFEDEEWTDGDRHLLASGLPLHGPDGRITGGIIAAVDVTKQRNAEAQIARQLVELNDAHRELETLNARLAALATTDALTGIPNHRAFQDRLAHMVLQAQRGASFALAMVDVDRFKDFNDTFGHQAGDEVLVRVAEALANNIRRTDFVARYGGEEFGVVLGDVGEELAVKLCEKLRQTIEGLDCGYRQITASFGVCGFTSDLGTAEALIKAADDALYRAKQAGRNRVERHSANGDRRAA